MKRQKERIVRQGNGRKMRLTENLDTDNNDNCQLESSEYRKGLRVYERMKLYEPEHI